MLRYGTEASEITPTEFVRSSHEFFRHEVPERERCFHSMPQIAPTEFQPHDVPKLVTGVSATPSYSHTCYVDSTPPVTTLSFCSDLEPPTDYVLPFHNNQTESRNDNQNDAQSDMYMRPSVESNPRHTLPCSDVEMMVTGMQSLAVQTVHVV